MRFKRVGWNTLSVLLGSVYRVQLPLSGCAVAVIFKFFQILFWKYRAVSTLQFRAEHLNNFPLNYTSYSARSRTETGQSHSSFYNLLDVILKIDVLMLKGTIDLSSINTSKSRNAFYSEAFIAEDFNNFSLNYTPESEQSLDRNRTGPFLQKSDF